MENLDCGYRLLETFVNNNVKGKILQNSAHEHDSH